MFDITTIGSATIDIFVNTKNKLFKDQIPFGEKILLDDIHIFPGGGAINTAIHFSRFGLKTACIAKIGKDYALPQEINKKYLLKDKNSLSNYSIILDSNQGDRVILISNNLKLNFKEIKFPRTKWIYVASLNQDFLNNLINLNCRIVLNTRKAPRGLLKKAEILILNQEEAEEIGADSKMAKLLVITNKDQEIKAYYKNEVYKIMPDKNIKVVERTGAGDAFAAGFVYGIIKKNDINFGLEQGLELAQKVVQKIGATNY